MFVIVLNEIIFDFSQFTDETTGRIQSQTEVILLDVAKASADTATLVEIKVLIEALRSSVQVVRDAGLRGLYAMKNSMPTYGDNYTDEVFNIARQIYITRFDVDSENR